MSKAIEAEFNFLKTTRMVFKCPNCGCSNNRQIIGETLKAAICEYCRARVINSAGGSDE